LANSDFTAESLISYEAVNRLHVDDFAFVIVHLESEIGVPGMSFSGESPAFLTRVTTPESLLSEHPRADCQRKSVHGWSNS
jgi:hypothetical protein